MGKLHYKFTMENLYNILIPKTIWSNLSNIILIQDNKEDIVYKWHSSIEGINNFDMEYITKLDNNEIKVSIHQIIEYLLCNDIRSIRKVRKSLDIGYNKVEWEDFHIYLV